MCDSPCASCVQVSNEPSDEAIRHTLDYLHQKAKSVNAVTVTEADAVRPMMEVRRKHGPPSSSSVALGCVSEGGCPKGYLPLGCMVGITILLEADMTRVRYFLWPM